MQAVVPSVDLGSKRSQWAPCNRRGPLVLRSGSGDIKDSGGVHGPDARRAVASTTGAGCRYCSQVVVTPLLKSSSAPSVIPQNTSSSVSNASRGPDRFVQPAPRAEGRRRHCAPGSCGEWPWQLTSPGMSRPPTSRTSVPLAAGSSGLPTHEMSPSSISMAPGVRIRSSRSTVKSGVRLQAQRHGAPYEEAIGQVRRHSQCFVGATPRPPPSMVPSPSRSLPRRPPLPE